MVTTQEDVIVLSPYPKNTAPCILHGQWFAERPAVLTPESHSFWEFERRCIVALVVKGIGRRRCPARRPWAYLTIAGALVTALSGKRVEIPDTVKSYHDIELVSWEALWEAARDYEGRLDRGFLGVILRNFLAGPRSESRFSDRWNDEWGFADSGGILCHLRQERILEARRALRQLPPQVVASIEEVAQHVPTMLKVTVSHIERVYGL